MVHEVEFAQQQATEVDVVKGTSDGFESHRQFAKGASDAKELSLDKDMAGVLDVMN
jgi:hypothetical protein